MLSHTRANTELFPSRSHGFRSDMRCKDTTGVLYCDDFYQRCERRYHSVNHITKTTINLISNTNIHSLLIVTSKYAPVCRENRPL